MEWALSVIRVPASIVRYRSPEEEIRSELRIHPHGMSLSATAVAASVQSAVTTPTFANTLAGPCRVNEHCPERLEKGAGGWLQQQQDNNRSYHLPAFPPCSTAGQGPVVISFSLFSMLRGGAGCGLLLQGMRHAAAL